MLKGIPKVLNPDLLKALAEMGHGDIIVIADDFYPAVSMAQSGRTIHADGIGAAEMVDAVLQLMPLDTEYTEHPVLIMDMMEHLKGKMERPAVWDDFIKAVEKNEPKGADCVGFIERFDVYDKAKTAFVTVSTGERQPYGCIMLQKGVM
ncbi:MAG: RbsD/FucU domain-containing protein [Lachnospiraceae bacterium]|nr:RbsD/FucU domain-containing protein [Lachnospiraceae bacterium]